jgi:hypothetical protein
MELEIDLRPSPPQAALRDPDDFGSFRVVLLDEAEPLEAILSPAGVARLDEHAWVRIDALGALAGASATPEWEASLAGMIDFARSRGWVDDDLEAVRGHVLRRRPG